ncbi:MAG: LysR family transcriptional regulator [Pseudomonadota bacterium]
MAHHLDRLDLNLLVCLDVLLAENNVTRAAQRLGISQPAMSNSLRRLRQTFDDPLLVRTSNGMSPTERARQLRPDIRNILSQVERIAQPVREFDAAASDRTFRIMASDYAETSLLPEFLRQLRRDAPDVTVDILTPSDVTFDDVDQGKLDLVINRFDDLPGSFHRTRLWTDAFACVLGKARPTPANFDLDHYLNARHVWVSKTGMGVGVGIDPDDVQRLGWVDEALAKLDCKRNIAVFTRHYPAAIQHAEQQDLIATVPLRAARAFEGQRDIVLVEPPFAIPPIELTMAWSPLLHNDPGHRWFRGLIKTTARASEVAPVA